jgi:hypothetical protein
LNPRQNGDKGESWKKQMQAWTSTFIFLDVGKAYIGQVVELCRAEGIIASLRE